MDKIRMLLLVSVLVCGSLAMCFYMNCGNRGDEEDKAFHLVEPALAQVGNTTKFLKDEAGLSIYLKLGIVIDLARAKTAFRTIEKETSEYIIGSISLPDLPENDDPHGFVHTNGWLVIYYLKTDLASKIVNWNYWSQNFTKNKLEIGLEKVCYAIQNYATGAKYYHFQFPDANKFTIIIETHKNDGQDNFTISVPSEVVVYEKSWFHYAKRTSIYGITSMFKIDEKEISIIGDSGTKYGQIAWDMLSPDQFHTANISGNQGGEYGICIALIYHEP